MFRDLKSSVVAFLVALPLCLGIALASHAPLSSGLIAGIIGGIVIGLLSGSNVSVSGPAAGLAVIGAASIEGLGDFKIFSLAVLLSGVFQIFFALIKAGKLGNFFPTSVIKGMLSAIGLILVLKQIPHALGLDVNYMGSEEFLQNGNGNTFETIISALKIFAPNCVLITAMSFALILFWDKFTQKVQYPVLKFMPSALLAVVASLFVGEFLLKGTPLEITSQHLVQLPFSGGLSSFISQLSFPDWSAMGNSRVYTVAMTIAIVGSLETLLSLDAADKIDPEKRIAPKNMELFAQGSGNFLSGLLGGLPITAVIVRTSANVGAGAKTKLSAILHGCWLLLSVLLIPQVLNHIPLAALATILILVGYKLTKPELYIKMFRKGADQFVPFIVTIIAILLTDLLKGICIGMIVGFFFVFKRSHYQSVVMVNDQQDYLIRFMKDNSFLQKEQLVKILQEIPDGSAVTIDGSKDVFIDDDLIDLIEDFVQSSEERNIKVDLKKSTTALSHFFKYSQG